MALRQLRSFCSHARRQRTVPSSLSSSSHPLANPRASRSTFSLLAPSPHLPRAFHSSPAHKNHFETLSIPISFDVDPALLASRKKTLQKQQHPDVVQNHPAAAAAAGAPSSAEINAAFDSLVRVHSRANHILELHGVGIREDDDEKSLGALGADDVEAGGFYAMVMELMEEIMEAESPEEVARIKERVDALSEEEENEARSAFAAALDMADQPTPDNVEAHWADAKRVTARLQYIKRINQLLKEKLHS